MNIIAIKLYKMIRNIRLDKMKIKNKNYFKNKIANIDLIKQTSRYSFEKAISDDTQQFDLYITKIYSKMILEQSQSPDLVIPKKFKEFIDSKLFKELLKKIYEYMVLVQQFQLKHQNVIVENNIKMKKVMVYESNVLQDKCKEISYVYMGILLSYAQSKHIFKDQYFFQTMIYFLSQLLKESFQDESFPLIDEELNRIFRTDTFNLIKRRYEEDEVIKQYPQLKDARYCKNAQSDNRLARRLTAHKKFRYSVNVHLHAEKSLPKPLNVSQTAFKSIFSRSPLIASFYPSTKQKLFNFNKQYSELKAVRSMVNGSVSRRNR